MADNQNKIEKGNTVRCCVDREYLILALTHVTE